METRFDTHGKSIAHYVREGDRAGLELTADDFEYIDGEWTLDGMPASEWIEAMVSD